MEKQEKTAATEVSGENQLHNFDRLTDGLKNAVAKFQVQATPENFALIVTALSEFGISGADLWRQVANYSKRHPVRVGLFAGLVFFALKGLAPEAQARRLSSTTIH